MAGRQPFRLAAQLYYQHFNGSGDEPARFFSVNSMPIVFNLFHDADFIFNTPRDFTDRFDGDPDTLAAKAKPILAGFGIRTLSPTRAILRWKIGRSAAEAAKT